jgi:hypothetical protein
MAADTRSARQKEGLTTAINALLASNLPGPLTAENLGAAKDSLVNAIAATYPDATDKLQAFIDALASHMGEAYPLETYKSHLNLMQTIKNAFAGQPPPVVV